MNNLDRILKSRDTAFPTNIHLVKAMVFPLVKYRCENWTVEKVECQRIDAFELWYWRRLLRVPWTARRSNQSIQKEMSPEYSLEGLMLKLKFHYFGHLMRRTGSLEKTLLLGNTALLLSLFNHLIMSNTLQPIGLQHPRALSCHLPKLAQVHDIASMMTSSHFILWQPLLLLPSIFPSISNFSYESAVCIRWPKYWSFSFSVILPMSIQGWFPLTLTGLIFLSKGLSRVFSSTTVQRHQFFGASPSLRSSSHNCRWHWKTIALSMWTFVNRVKSLLCVQ